MDLQEAIERFLNEAERRRAPVTVKRYAEAMELLQSFLALELMEPEGEEPPTLQGIEDLTAERLDRFVRVFLGERLQTGARTRGRYVAAVRAFVRWQVKAALLPRERGDERLAALRRVAGELGEAGEADPPEDGGPEPAPGDPEALRFYQVMRLGRRRIALVDLDTGQEAAASPPVGLALEPGSLVAGVPERTLGDRTVVSIRRPVSESELSSWHGSAPDDAPPDWIEDDEDEDEDDDEDDEDGPDLPSVEEALEVLAVEDRYAPREVVRVVLNQFDEARDDLLEWLTEDAYRNDPIPGVGEAPANAARILSEMGDPEAVPRLLESLGDQDPLGEEAPLGLARFGPLVEPDLVEVLKDPGAALARRGAAAWALGFVAARNPARRGAVIDLLVVELARAPLELGTELLGVLEELRAVEALGRTHALAAAGDLDFEARQLTEDLFVSRVQADGWGERVAEALLPILSLYPTSEELEEFYSTLQDDLGDLWDEADGEEDEPEDEPEGPGPGSSPGGKVIPFRRPRP